jgi:hypothetical protein
VGDDRPAVAEASQMAKIQAADHQAPHPVDAGDCQHGHCHHNAPMLGGPIEAEPALIQAGAPSIAAQARTLASLDPAGLERPPRA